MINLDIEKNFKRLKEEQNTYLQSCNEKIKNWETFQGDYNQLKQLLTKLPNELNYEIMVPVSKVAFMPGKLVHTNEILVLLGDNWFTERTAYQAIQIIDRRLDGINKHLNDLQKEKNALIDQITWSDNIFQDNGEFVTIEEKIDDLKPSTTKQLSEEDKKELRRKQQERALKTQSEINQSLKNDTRLDDKDTDDDGLNNQDDLKNNEEMTKLETDSNKKKNQTIIQNKASTKEKSLTFEDMLKEYEKSINRENNLLIKQTLDKNSEFLEEKLENVKTVRWLDNDASKNVNTDESNDDIDDDDDDDEEENENYLSEIIKTPIANVINIKHSKSEEITELERNRNVSRLKAELDNPGDIYTKFYKPKSILKQSSLTTIPVEEIQASNSMSDKINEKKHDQSKAFTGEIVERPFPKLNTDTETSRVPPQKRISKFKEKKLAK